MAFPSLLMWGLASLKDWRCRVAVVPRTPPAGLGFSTAPGQIGRLGEGTFLQEQTARGQKAELLRGHRTPCRQPAPGKLLYFLHPHRTWQSSVEGDDTKRLGSGKCTLILSSSLGAKSLGFGTGKP